MDKPKGKLFLIGGAEDKGDSKEDDKLVNIEFEQFEILKQLLAQKPKQGKLEIITTATRYPGSARKRYHAAFKKLGVAEQIDFIHIVNREEAHDPKLVKRLEKCHAVFFTGGSQYRLATILGSTPVLNTMAEKYMRDEHFIIAGTSAGAMAAGTLMISEGATETALLKGTVKTSSGLGFIQNCLIDTHFLTRGRFGRLTEAIIGNPNYVGIGLSEDTGLLIHEANRAECYGSGMVIIIDGQFIGHTNIAYIEDRTPICVENLTVHVMARGNNYLLHERKFIPGQKELEEEKKTRV